MNFIFAYIFTIAVLLPDGGCQNWQNGIVVIYMSQTERILSVQLIKHLLVTFNV